MSQKEEKLLDIARRLKSISEMYEMFPKEVGKNVLMDNAEGLRKIADELEEIK